MANTTTGNPVDLTLPPPPARINLGFTQNSPQTLQISVRPFGTQTNDFPNPLGPRNKPLTQDLQLAQFLGLPTTNTKPFNQTDFPVPEPDRLWRRREALWFRGQSNYTPNIIGTPLIQLIMGGAMHTDKVPAQGNMSTAQVIRIGLMP